MAIRRITVRGRKVWQARVAVKGKRTSQLCASREEARTVEAALLQELTAAETSGGAPTSLPATMRHLLHAYELDLEARGKPPEAMRRVRDVRTAAGRVLPAFLDTAVSAITDADLWAYRRARAASGVTPATTNRDFVIIRTALKKARPDFRMPAGLFAPDDHTRVRFLRPEDEVLVFGLMPSPFRAMAQLAALTLMRQGELRTLRWDMVHLDQGVVLLPRAKAGARPVVLSQAAIALLREQAVSGPWVFPAPHGAPYSRTRISRVFRRASRAAGLRDFRFHDLRHHGATMALNRGFTSAVVMTLGGWKSERMMRRYAAVTDTTLRAAAEAVSGAPDPWGRGNGAWHAPLPRADRARET